MDEDNQVPQLLSDFCDAAVRKGDADVTTEQDQQLLAAMATAVRALRALEPGTMDAFRVLLRHASEHVRLWVAAELVADGDADAKRVLQALAAQRGLTGLNASVVLDELNAGRFRSPFSGKSP